MSFFDDCEKYFQTKNLYEILGVDKKATESQIKSGYRKKSLKVHPDRVNDSHKEVAKQAFQLLTKVHLVLTNENSRKLYDESGIVCADEESEFSSFEEFNNYWRTLFPKIETKHLDEFANKYIGSKEEEEDLKKLYLKFKGDLDLIYEYHFYYDEDRVCENINRLIESNEVPAFDSFVKESKSKKQKRLKRIKKENALADKESEKMAQKDSDLILAIQNKNKNSFDQMIGNLEAKYGKKQEANKNKKRRV